MKRFNQALKAHLFLYKDMIRASFVLAFLSAVLGWMIAHTDVEGLSLGLTIAPVVALGFLVGMTSVLVLQNFPLLVESGVTRKHYFWSEHLAEALPVLFFSLGITLMYYFSGLPFFESLLPQHPVEIFLVLFLLGLCITGFVKLLAFLVKSENFLPVILFVLLMGVIYFLLKDPLTMLKKPYFLLTFKILLSFLFYMVVKKAPSR